MKKNKIKENAESQKNEWNIYWDKPKKEKNSFYGIVAEFYRKNIIKKALNEFIKEQFNSKSKLLHAGCGSGQVDTDLHDLYNLTALDISQNALDIYKKTNINHRKIMLGSIFKIPSKKSTYDGIYNLGVMEHFSEEEINKILIEFKRVLKPNGKLVIFWPPKFGPTVIILNIFHFILNKIFCKKTKFHPPEITLIKSKKQAKEIFEKSGFKIEKYYFGIKDAFTHIIIIAEKIND